MYRDCQAHFSVPVVRVPRCGCSVCARGEPHHIHDGGPHLPVRETEYLWVFACQRPKGHAGAHASFASRKP